MSRTLIHVIDDKMPTLDEAQAMVEGYVESVMLHNGQQLLINEDGIMKQLPLNSVASKAAHQPILGNVVWLIGAARWIPENER